MRTRRIFSLFVALGLLTFVVTGCSDDDSPTQPAAPMAKVMAIHASPDAPTVDVLVDNAVAASNLSFPQNTQYLDVAAGTRNVKINVAGTDDTALELPAVPITAGAVISVFAIDSVENLSALALIDDLTAPAAGKSHIRFVHLSPNAPAVDITDNQGNVIFGDVEFAEESGPFTPVDAGTYNLQVRIAGTNNVVLELPNIGLTDGKIYTVFAKGFVGGQGDQALGAEIIVNN